MKSDADSLRSTPTPRAEPVSKPDETLPPTRRIVTARPPHPRSRLRGHPQASSAVSSSQLSRRKSLSAAEFRHRCNIVRRAELPPIRAVELRDQAFSWPFWTAGRRAGPFCTSPVRPGHKSLLLFTIGARNLPSGNGTSAVYSFSLRPFLGTLYGIDHPLIVQLVAALQAEGAALGQTPT
jgi:hypothetical protein